MAFRVIIPALASCPVSQYRCKAAVLRMTMPSGMTLRNLLQIHLCCLLQPVSRLSHADIEHELCHTDVPHLILGLLLALYTAVATSAVLCSRCRSRAGALPIRRTRQPQVGIAHAIKSSSGKVKLPLQRDRDVQGLIELHLLQP
jgi:hypothetical protein